MFNCKVDCFAISFRRIELLILWSTHKVLALAGKITPYLELIKELRISNTLYICFCIERDIPGFQKSKISSNSLSSVSHNRLTSSLQDACWKLKNSSFWTLLTNFYIYKINLKKNIIFTPTNFMTYN
jgi:UDP-N-acetyl-D-mannosaminuronate dehydrogenase